MPSPTISAVSSSPASSPEAKTQIDAANSAGKPGRPGVWRTWADRLAPAAALIVLICVWEGACRLFRIPSYLLPAPSAIVIAGLNVTPAQWVGNIGATLRVALIGYVVAIAVSIPLAVGLVSSPLWSGTL